MVKCTLVQALRLCTGRTAYRWSRGIALTFHGHGTRRGLEVSLTPRPLFTPGKDPVPIVQEVGWAPRPVWTGAQNLAPTGIRSPDRLACSQSLHRLSYRAHMTGSVRLFIFFVTYIHGSLRKAISPPPLINYNKTNILYVTESFLPKTWFTIKTPMYQSRAGQRVFIVFE